jgi:hypothetical protein
MHGSSWKYPMDWYVCAEVLMTEQWDGDPLQIYLSNRKLYINTHTATFLIIFSVLFGKKNFHLLD